MPLTRYVKIFAEPDRPDTVLLYSTKKGSVVRASKTLLDAAQYGTLKEAECDVLKRMELWTDDPAVERAAMLGLVDRSNAASRSFMATVVLTLECNLACPYCFEDHFRGNYIMNADTSQLLIDYVKREQIDRGNDVELRFYGGEPLMAIPRLKEIARPLFEAAKNAGTGFSFSLVTNATLLTRPVVKDLLPLGLNCALITIDGPPEIHNAQRPFVSGAGSFDTIIKNLKSVYELVTIKPGGNFTRENYRAFPAVLDALIEAGIDPAKLGQVQFSPVHPKSGAQPMHGGSCIVSDEEWLCEAITYLRHEILRRGFAVEKLNMGICMIELDNNMVINYDGSLYKCPGFMGWPEFRIGTLADGINDYSQSHNLDVWKNDECLDCAYLPLCFGGCRFMRKLRTGAIDGVDCRRDLLDATLETIVRQDLEMR